VIFVAAILLILVVLPLLAITNTAVKRRQRRQRRLHCTQQQAKVLTMHLSRGTATPSMKALLRSISRDHSSSRDISREVSGDHSSSRDQRSREIRALQRLGLDLAGDEEGNNINSIGGGEGELLDPLLPLDPLDADTMYTDYTVYTDATEPSAPPAEHDESSPTQEQGKQASAGSTDSTDSAQGGVGAEQAHTQTQTQSSAGHRVLVGALQLLERAGCVRLQYVQ
jgi:hypothetical protein